MHSPIAIGAAAMVGLFLGILLLLELGRHIRLRLTGGDHEKPIAGLGVVEGALFGLMGLVIAFTFSGAAARFDARRHLVVNEANAIGTAYLRLDLLPASEQPLLRDAFRRYLDARLGAYRALPDIDAAMALLRKAEGVQREIWNLALDATREAPTPQAGMLLLPALNAMFDIASTRYWATEMHPPAFIFALLAMLALICALLAGFGMAGGRQRNWIHILSFAAILTLTVYVIVDMEYPRVGFVRVDAFDRALADVRAGMK